MFNFGPAVISYTSMDNFIKNLEIKNFKSIKHLSLDCKRVNVFIGKPNVGKSNILEALGLFSVPYIENNLLNLTRFKKIDDLFFDFSLSDTIEVSIDNGYALTLTFKELFSLNIYNSKNHIQSTHIARNGEIIRKEDYFTNSDLFAKYYKFKLFIPEEWHLKKYLYPPFGDNLFEIVKDNAHIRERIVAMLKEYQLEFVASVNEREFKTQKNIDGFVTQYPYSSIADTFQRFIFYLAAIESNSNSILIFEEPEVHSFPPYVKELAERMILKDDNQYFVSTHSPYLLQTFIDSLDDTQLNVYLTYYKDYQTHVKALTPDELSDIQRFGYDVFFNLKKFEPND